MEKKKRTVLNRTTLSLRMSSLQEESTALDPTIWFSILDLQLNISRGSPCLTQQTFKTWSRSRYQMKTQFPHQRSLTQSCRTACSEEDNSCLPKGLKLKKFRPTFKIITRQIVRHTSKCSMEMSGPAMCWKAGNNSTTLSPLVGAHQ